MSKRALRVAIGMSGGVDSTVSAFLLKKKGCDVTGIYMVRLVLITKKIHKFEVNWDSQEEGSANCSRTKDEADARKACDRLEIPFVKANFVKEYWNEIFL